MLQLMKEAHSELQDIGVERKALKTDLERKMERTIGNASRILSLQSPAKIITITLEGGLVQDVIGLPASYELHVEDHDEGDTSHPSWDEERKCFVTIYEGGTS
jgi:hypothetical protein